MVKRVIFLIMVVCFVSMVGIAAYSYFRLQLPVTHEDSTFVVARGTPMIMIAEQLSRAGIIKNPILFTVAARLTRSDRRLKAGEYEFQNGLSAFDVLRKLVRGECRLYKITLIEGWTYKQMADYLGSQPFASNDFGKSFAASASDRYFLSSLGVEGDTAEGYLFPNTYLIQRPRTADWLVSYLVSALDKVYTEAFDSRAKELGLSKRQVLTLASIIEKETGGGSETALVSSVFHNRLKKGMPLQADPTVIYAIKDYNGNIRKSDLSNPSPYNTYVHAGLPPGPIANPGLASIKAALWPAETDYLYFVAKGDGTHHFSATYPEHSKAVVKYQLKR